MVLFIIICDTACIDLCDINKTEDLWPHACVCAHQTRHVPLSMRTRITCMCISWSRVAQTHRHTRMHTATHVRPHVKRERAARTRISIDTHERAHARWGPCGDRECAYFVVAMRRRYARNLYACTFSCGACAQYKQTSSWHVHRLSARSRMLAGRLCAKIAEIRATQSIIKYRHKCMQKPAVSGKALNTLSRQHIAKAERHVARQCTQCTHRNLTYTHSRRDTVENLGEKPGLFATTTYYAKICNANGPLLPDIYCR